MTVTVIVTLMATVMVSVTCDGNGDSDGNVGVDIYGDGDRCHVKFER